MLKLLLRLPLSWRVLLPPAISIVCLILYVALATTVFSRNNHSLESVRDVQFPLLDTLTANVAALDKLVNTLSAAAMSADNDTLRAAEQVADKIRANLSKLDALAIGDRAGLKRLADEFDAYYSVAHKIVQKIVTHAGDPDPNEFESMGKLLETHQKDLNAYREDAHKHFTETVADATRAADSAQIIGLIAGLIGLAASSLFGFVVARSLLRQFGGEPEYAVEVARQVAHGNFTMEIALKAHDDSSLLAAMRDMKEKLSQIIGDVRNTTEDISTASQEIAQGNADLSQRTEEQASSLEETASSMEELTSTVKQNAENAKQANQLATNASDIAVKGGKVVGEVVQTMASISTSSKKIVDIISVIESIAFQTNILALNAAVEAARAGQHGRGFAVVAGEVRNLAQRSAAAAKEIKTLIDDSVGKVDTGSKQVDQAGATMSEIVAAVKRVTDIMAEIAAASNEQSSGIEQVNQAIIQMDEMTQRNAALVEEAAAAAEAMQEQAGGLMEAVSIFKLEGSRNSLAAVKQPEVKQPARPAIGHRTSTAVRTVSKDRKLVMVKSNKDGDWNEF